MNNPEHLSAEEASRLAVTATAADLEDWGRSVAANGHLELNELLVVLDVLRSASLPHQHSAQEPSWLSAS
jgi:hypothetical protein